MRIEERMNEIIPPSDYQHRDGFTNVAIIDSLTDLEKKQVEDALIYKLLYESEKNIDTLVVDTLVYLNSKKAVPILREMLRKSQSNFVNLVIASSIFQLDQSEDMIDFAIESVKLMDSVADPYSIFNLADSFVYLVKFKNDAVKKLISDYVLHSSMVVSNNAKRALEKYA